MAGSSDQAGYCLKGGCLGAGMRRSYTDNSYYRRETMKQCAWLLLLGLAAGAQGAELPPWLIDQTPGGSLQRSGAASGGWIQDRAGAWQGTGGNRGQTWRQTTSGAWQGSGANRGQTWVQTPSGMWKGYGTVPGTPGGQIWQPGPAGNWRDRGQTQGPGWRPQAPHGWTGTGTAAGESWRAGSPGR